MGEGQKKGGRQFVPTLLCIASYTIIVASYILTTVTIATIFKVTPLQNGTLFQLLFTFTEFGYPMEAVGYGEEKGDEVVNPTYDRYRVRRDIYRDKDIHQCSERSDAGIEFVSRALLHYPFWL